MGPALVIVVLTMPKKNVEKRLEKRHAKKEEKETVGWLMVIKFLRNYVYFTNILSVGGRGTGEDKTG